MIEKVHQHIVNELQQSSKTDTVFVITAVLFNLLVLAINSAVAGNAVSDKARASDDVILIIFILVAILVNVAVSKALGTGKRTRLKLLDGLVAMYKDNNVDKYYEASLLTNYGKRYLLFNVVILCLTFTSIAVPLIIRFI